MTFLVSRWRCIDRRLDALVEIVASSPAINVDREPHGYAWHRHIVQLVEDPAWDKEKA